MQKNVFQRVFESKKKFRYFTRKNSECNKIKKYLASC